MALRKRRPALGDTSGDTSKGDATRKHIKRVIVGLASQRPVYAITLADICKGANLTTGALYFHFGGKDAAVEEMVIDEVRVLYREMLAAPGESFDEYVRAAIVVYASYLEDNGRLPKALYSVIATSRTVGSAWLKIRQPVIDKLIGLIANIREQADLSIKPAAFLAHFILNSIEDVSMDAFQWNNTELAGFAKTIDEWKNQQGLLWSWAIHAPFEE